MTEPFRVTARARAPRAPRASRRIAKFFAAAAAATVLAVPAIADAAANPLMFNYSNSPNMSAYAKPTGAVVVGRNFTNTTAIDQVQAGGGEVYMYVDVIDGWNGTASGFEGELYGVDGNNGQWLWSPRRTNWGGTPMTDMRPGSPWVLHAVDAIKRWFPTTHAKGIFLDVVGERLWTSGWDAMSATEKSQWTAGNRDFVARLRAALGPNVILIANNSWTSGNPNLNGITVEHHPFSQSTFWSTMTSRSDWAKPVRNIVIANSNAEAMSWANVPGVTHVSAQSSAMYGGPVAPILPFSPLPGVGTTPAPPPSTQPAPPPSTQPAPAPTKPTAPAPGPAVPATPDPDPDPVPADGGQILTGNLLANASFEGSLAGWSSWRGVLSNVATPAAPHGDRVSQAKFGGVGDSFTIGDFPGRVTTPSVGARYTARAYVRAVSSSSVGKPATLYVRERIASGATLQQVRGPVVTLSSAFVPVTVNVTSKAKGSKLDVMVTQAKASNGDVIQADALSMAPVGATAALLSNARAKKLARAKRLARAKQIARAKRLARARAAA